MFGVSTRHIPPSHASYLHSLPLDGSRVLTAVLPARLYYKVMQYEQYIIYGVFIILMLGWLDGPLSFLRGVVYNFLNLITGFLG